jgi:hypothetical protein
MTQLAVKHRISKTKALRRVELLSQQPPQPLSPEGPYLTY